MTDIAKKKEVEMNTQSDATGIVINVAKNGYIIDIVREQTSQEDEEQKHHAGVVLSSKDEVMQLVRDRLVELNLPVQDSGMSDMVERVARKMCLQNGTDPDGIVSAYAGTDGPVWLHTEHPLWLHSVADSRPLIEAALKVTDEDADIFFGRGKERSGMEFVNHGWMRDFATGMQALSDAALGGDNA